MFSTAAEWKTPDDVYDALFKAFGAPAWHGRNFNALNDSIAHGNINEVEVPYRLVIQNNDLMGSEARKMVDNFIDLIHEIAARGCPVEIRADKKSCQDQTRRRKGENCHSERSRPIFFFRVRSSNASACVVEESLLDVN